MTRLGWSLCLCLLAFAAVSLPAMADQTTFFNDFGPGNSYIPTIGGTIAGSASGLGESYTRANEFTSEATGSVSQIDWAVGYLSGTNSFFAALYTANGNAPGTLIQQWNGLSSNQNFGYCCGVVTVSGISGLTLSAGQSYFMVLGPTDLDSTTYEAWNINDQNVNGLDLYANTGCQNGSGDGCRWINTGVRNISAFDIVGASVPEPSSLVLLGSGLAGALATVRKKLMR